jgi:hypothetical protein
MADEPPRRVFVGVIPTGNDVTYIDGADDPAATMIAQATARLDRMREEDERIRLAALADVERAKNTRKARVMRRLGKVLKVFRRS